MLPYPITSDALIWDELNTYHITRHGVEPDGANEGCDGRFLVLQGYAGRFMFVELTLSGRMLAGVLAPRYDEKYYVVTARPASRRERRMYGEVIG